MSKLLLLMIVLIGCGPQSQPQTCEYGHLDRQDLTCISIPAAKWNYRHGKVGSVFIGDVCRAQYQGEWIYGNTDTGKIRDTINSGASYLDVDIQFVTSYGEVSQYTCYYYNVE